MSNYTKTVDFAAKDSLPSGDSGKIIKGTEFETEFDNIATAIATKSDSAGPTFTGVLTFASLKGTGATTVTTILDEDDMATDSATALATQQSIKAYVDAQQDTVDTLAEILALGNTTGGTDLAVSTGDDITFADSSKAIFGDGSDLQIYHNGSNSFIDDAGTGNLQIRANAQIKLQKYTGENMFVGIADGAASMYYDNAQKIATTDTGIDVTGTVTADGLTVDGLTAINSTTPEIRMFETDTTDLNTQLRSGVGKFEIKTLNDAVTLAKKRFEIDHATGDISFYEDTGTTPKFFWDASAESLGIGETSITSGYRLQTREDVDGDSKGLLVANRDVTASGSQSVSVNFGLSRDSGAFKPQAGRIRVGRDSTTWDGSDANIDSYMDFSVYDSNVLSTKMTIDSSGNVGIGTASPATLLELKESSTGAGDAIIRLRGNGNNANNTPLGSLEWFNADSSGAQPGVVAAVEAQSSNANGHMGKLLLKTHDGSGSEADPPTTRMTIDQSGNVKIGTATDRFSYLTASTANLQIDGGVVFEPGSGNNVEIFNYRSTDMLFGNGATEAMRIDANGNLLVGKTSTGVATAGIELNGANDLLRIARDGGVLQELNRITSDGDIIEFRKDNTAVGTTGVVNSDNLRIGGVVADHAGLQFGTNILIPETAGTASDGLVDIGTGSNRYQDVYATNGTIQTSDGNEKQDIEALSDAEQRVAVAAKGLLRKFRWKSAVEAKGDEARTHFGIIAQDLQAAFAAEGLDAGDYGMFINSTWTDEVTGEERSRMGVRYSELLAFIIAAI